MTDDEIEEYGRHVRESQRMAENSRSEHDRAAWLRIAEQWLRMLRVARGDETAQADQSKWPAARDDDSKSSH
jgi:hypothetical protein